MNEFTIADLPKGSTSVQEFRRFLEAAVDGEEKVQTIMVEIR